MRFGYNIGDSLSCLNSKARPAIVNNELEYETAWGNPRITKEYIEYIVSCGFDSIKIPVTWSPHISPINDIEAKISNVWLSRVKQVVEYCTNMGVECIIDCHHDEEWIKRVDIYSPEYISTKFYNMWYNIAKAFQFVSPLCKFESLNEVGIETVNKYAYDKYPIMGDFSYSFINHLNNQFVKAVRSAGGCNNDRQLICAGLYSNTRATIGYGSDGKSCMIYPKDNNIVSSVHQYDPWQFTIPVLTPQDDYYKINIADHAKNLETSFSRLYRASKVRGIKHIITEFGCNNANDHDSCYKYILKMYLLAIKYDIDLYVWDNGTWIDRNNLCPVYPDLDFKQIIARAKRGGV